MVSSSKRTHLEYLLLETMRRVVPDVAAECRQQWAKQGHPGEPDRTALVHCLLRKTGPKRFLTLCEKLPAHVPESPLIFLLFNSPSPGVLIRKISAHAPHFHPTRRLELVEEGENYCIVEDIENTSARPSIADDMFVHSILKGALQEFGCKDIAVSWEAVSSNELYKLLTEIGIQPLSVENVTRWRYSWEAFSPPGSIKGMDEFFLRKTGLVTGDQAAPLTRRVEKLLLENLRLRPSTEEIAVKLGISPRTMQRKLEAEGTSYSRIYTELRVTTAENLLRQTALPLAEVSGLTGFNDSSHLCREFKKRYNTTPNTYRKSSCAD